VESLRREGSPLFLRRVDMPDGTPVLDIKPYTSSIPMEKLRRGCGSKKQRNVRNNRIFAA
jgi:tRNA (Thr-GGU) A37 N-methylase